MVWSLLLVADSEGSGLLQPSLISHAASPRTDSSHAQLLSGSTQPLFQALRHTDVHMIALHRVLHDAEVVALTHLPEAALKGSNEPFGTQRRHVFEHPQRDVAGPSSGKSGRLTWWTIGLAAAGLPAPGRGPPRPIVIR